jgi:hypothetical protein
MLSRIFAIFMSRMLQLNIKHFQCLPMPIGSSMQHGCNMPGRSRDSANFQTALLSGTFPADSQWSDLLPNSGNLRFVLNGLCR